MFLFRAKNYATFSDEQLMAKSSEGDKTAFETLYDRYFKKLVWFARGFVEFEPLAEDIVQEVFVGIIEKPQRFDNSKRFSTWVYVVTSNLCKQQLRNQKNRSRILDENSEKTEQITAQQNNFDKSLLKEKVQQLYQGLNEKEKQIYTLRFEQDLKIKDIAEILDLPEGSVKSGIYYLLKKMAQHLKDFNYE